MSNNYQLINSISVIIFLVKEIYTNTYYSTILKSGKLFGFLYHQALLIYKLVLLKNRLKNVNFNIG